MKWATNSARARQKRRFFLESGAHFTRSSRPIIFKTVPRSAAVFSSLTIRLILYFFTAESWKQLRKWRELWIQKDIRFFFTKTFSGTLFKFLPMFITIFQPPLRVATSSTFDWRHVRQRWVQTSQRCQARIRCFVYPRMDGMHKIDVRKPLSISAILLDVI